MRFDTGGGRYDDPPEDGSGVVSSDPREDRAIASLRGESRFGDPPLAVPREPAPHIVWILDDGLMSQYENRDLFINEGIQPEVGVITEKLGDDDPEYFDLNQLSELVDDEGWGLMNHSHAHEGYDGQTREQIESDVLTSEQLFAENGFRPDSFLYPQSQTAGNLGISIVSNWYGHAFHDRDAPVGMTSALNVAFSGKHPHLINRVAADERPLAEIEERIDAAVAANKPMFLGAHEIVPGTQADEGPLETSVGKIQHVIDYARTAGMTWGTYRDAVPEFPQWGINADPAGDEHFIRPHTDNGGTFYHAPDLHHFLGGAVRLPNLVDYSGVSQSIWWDNGSGTRDAGLYTEVGGEVTRVTVGGDSQPPEVHSDTHGYDNADELATALRYEPQSEPETPTSGCVRWYDSTDEAYKVKFEDGTSITVGEK